MDVGGVGRGDVGPGGCRAHGALGPVQPDGGVPGAVRVPGGQERRSQLLHGDLMRVRTARGRGDCCRGQARCEEQAQRKRTCSPGCRRRNW